MFVLLMKIGTYELRDLFSLSARLRYFSTNPSDQDTLALFALPAYYAKQVLWHSRMSVRPSVCPIHAKQRRPAGLLLSTVGRLQQISIDSRYACSRRSAANTGSVMLGAEERGSAQTCL